MSSSVPIAVLGGAYGLVLGFCIFNGCARDPLCMNFTISPFDQRMIPYLTYHAILILLDVYSLKGLYVSFYNDEMLFK